MKRREFLKGALASGSLLALPVSVSASGSAAAVIDDTVTDVTNIDDLVAAIEFGREVVEFDDAVKPWSRCPTGEKYVAFAIGSKGKVTEEDFVKAIYYAFLAYAIGREGKLYWRAKPEIRKGEGGECRVCMRLVISDEKKGKQFCA